MKKSKKKGFCSGFVAGISVNELIHKLFKEVGQSLKDMKLPVEKEDFVVKENEVNSYTETAKIDPEHSTTVDEFLKKEPVVE